METTSKLVFSEKRIVTSSLISKALKCNIDEANKLMYEFYQKNKANLETFFLVIRKDDNPQLIIERLSEKKLNHLLYDEDYIKTVLSLKIWAFIDRSEGDLDVNSIYEAEDADTHCIQNLYQNIRDVEAKKAEANMKKMSSTTPTKVSSQASTKKTQKQSQETVNPPKNVKDSQENIKKQPALQEVKNKITQNNKNTKTIEEEASAKPEETETQQNAKKRKGGTMESFAQAPGAKELKKTKFAIRSDSLTEEQKKPVEQKKPLEKKSSAIEMEEEEESYYPDEGEPIKKEYAKLKHSTSFERPSKEENAEPEKKESKKKPEAIQNKEKMVLDKNDTSEQPVHENINESPEEVTRVKRVRKVPRERTYMDEKGYLIVENEMVDEEYWETVKVKDTNKASNNNNGLQQAAAPKKKAPEKNQATLGNFFKKK